MKLFRGRGWCALLACALACAWAGVCSAGDTASVVLNGRTLSSDRQYWTYSDITLVHADNKPFKSLMISLTRELANSDKIVLPSDTSKIKVKSDLSTDTSKIVQIIGSTDAEIAAYLRTVKFYTVNNPKGQGVKVVATPEDISEKTFYFEKTRHYYQYVPASGGYKSWLQSYELAKNKRFMGRQGYLATVMSMAEDVFIYKVSQNVGWLGGTIFKHGANASINGNDLYYDGFQKSPYWVEDPRGDDFFDQNKYGDANYPKSVNPDGWYWACGPERGTVFFSPWVVSTDKEHAYSTWTCRKWVDAFQTEKNKGRYFNWEIEFGRLKQRSGVEPNQQREACLTTLASNDFVGYATQGTDAQQVSWNNLRDCNPGNIPRYRPTGFFVEYGNQLVGDTTETNPPKDWGVTEEPVPSIYYVKLEGVADAYYLASDVASNLWAAASIAALTPPDDVHTNFFGWSKTQGATVPDLIDQQPIQGYGQALETVNLYPVWTDKPVVTGRFMTRKEAEIFQLKAIDCNRQPAGTLVMTDGGGTEANLFCYAFSAPRGVYGFDITEKASGYGAWVDLVTIETDGVMAGPDFTQARIWDTLGNEVDYKSGLDKYALIGRFSQIRGANAKRPILFKTMPIFATAEQIDWAMLKFAEVVVGGGGAIDKQVLYHHPEVQATVRGADGGISARMKERWPALAEARSPDFMQIWLKMIGRYACLVNGNWISGNFPGPEPIYRHTTYATDIAPALKADEFVVAAIQDEDCRASATNLPWRIYRYYKGEDGKEHYDVIKQRHVGSEYKLANGSDGEDLGEYIELRDGYALIYLKRFGQLAFIDPTDVEIFPGEQYKQDESTWGWTNMIAYGEMKYDRMELTLHNSDNADDKIVFPAGLGWGPAGQPNQHQVYTNLTEATNVSICDIASNVLSKVRLVLPSNGDDIYWSIRLYRADGYKPYEFDIGISNAWYVVAYQPTIPGAGVAAYITYKNVRTINPPLAGANLGFGYNSLNFYCWQRNGRNYLDDGQPFFDISKAFQTNYLDAVWVETPVISGDCRADINTLTGAKLVSVAMTNEVSGDVFFAGAEPGRYVVTTQPGIYDLVYTDADGLPHTELIELSSGRVTGPDFASDLISTGVDNTNAEPGFKLLAGGLRAYNESVYGLCNSYFTGIHGHDYDHFSTPRFDLVSALVTDVERKALRNASHCFAVRSRMQMTFLSSADPNRRWTWPMGTPCRSDPVRLGDDGYNLGTNVLVELIVPFDTRPFAGCVNTWSIDRRGDDGNVETLTMTPNGKGEYFALTDGYLRLLVRTFGAFGIRPPDLTTKIDLGAADYTNEFGVSYFPAAQGSGDRLYSSVRIDLRNFDASSTLLGMVEMGLFDPEDYGAKSLTNSTSTSLCVRFAAPKTAAEIAAFIAHCLWVDSDYSFIGADVTVSCFENDSTEGEPAYTSEAGHIRTRAATLRFRPGTRGTVIGADMDFVAPSNTVQYLMPAELFFELGFWKTNTAETVNTYFYGWEFDGEVRFGAEQLVLNRFRIGETNVLTAVWTNMPVVAGDVAHDRDAASVSVHSFTNALEAMIFKGGADTDRYALPLPAGRPYNVAVEYRDTVGGEVMSVETVLVTNDVVNGATYDSTGRVETVTRVIRPDGDPDFVLVGGLEAASANAGHLAGGAAYEALKTAVGGNEGVYFDLTLKTNGVDVATVGEPVTALLPFGDPEVFDPTHFVGAYRYLDGAAAEVPADEYAVCGDYLALVSTNVAPVALVLASDVGIVPGGQVLLDDVTWGWPDMSAVGMMKYDRLELTLNNPGDPEDRIVFPEGTGWLPAGEQTGVRQVYTNATGSSGVPVREIAAGVLSKVRLVVPSNGDGITWTIRLSRADGRWTYELEVAYSASWYSVVYRPMMPGVSTAQLFTYTNSRAYSAPTAGEDLGFSPEGLNFYCWKLKGREFMDDGQTFVDIGKAFQTNYLDAGWVETPVVSGDCPANASGGAGVKLVSVGEADAAAGHVLYVGAAPARYVATAQPGLYDLVYTDADGLPRTELIGLSSGRATGPDFASDLISTGVDNANAEPGFKLLAGGIRAYGESVFGTCLDFLVDACVPEYDDFTLPRFELVSAKVTDAERSTLAATSHCFAVRARMSTRFFLTDDPDYAIDWNPPEQSDPSKLGMTGYQVDTNILVELVVPFDTSAYAGCTNTWAISRLGDDGAVDVLTTTPNGKGEGFAVTNGCLLLTVEKFGAFGVKTPDLVTKIDLGTPVYSNELDKSFFGGASGSGDRLYGSVRIDLGNVDGSDAGVTAVDAARHGATVLPGSTATRLLVKFDGPKTAADIAAFLRDCCLFDVGSSVIGADVTVSCFVNDAAEGEAQYTSEPAHLATRVAVLRFEPGGRSAQAVRETHLVCPSNVVKQLPSVKSLFDEGAWKANPAETVNTYFYGWAYDGAVSFGDTQQVLNKFRIGETNVLTAVWTNMPVVAGDVAHDRDAASVSVHSFTNALEAVIFKGGADLDRYALPLPAGRPYNVAVEYRDTVGGEVMSVETVLVTNDVVNGATYDSTGRVETVTRVIRPDGDPDFVLVGGLEAASANAGHLASGAAYEALKTAIGGKVGTYYDFGLETAGAATASAPMTLLLPYDTTAVLNPSNFFRVYRYQDGAVSELTANEYAVRDGYLELSATGSAAYALGLSGNVIIEDTGTNTVRWLATLSRASVFGQLNLRKVSGDFAEMTEPVFLFQDRVDTNGNDSVMLWNGRLMEQTAGNHAATNKMVFGGVEFRYVVLEGLRQRFIDTPNGGLVKFGLRDETFRNRVNGGYRIVSRTSDPAAVNEESCIELVSVNRIGATSIPDAKDIDGVLGFLMWSVGSFTNHIALASGHQGGVTNYVQAQRKVMSLAPTSPWRAPSAGAVLSGPPMPPVQLNTALAVGAYVDDGSSPYAEIVEFSVDGDVISGRIEVGAGAQVGSLGANAVVVMLASDSPGGVYSEVGSVVCDAEGRFAIARPVGRSFFKVRINIKEVLK